MLIFRYLARDVLINTLAVGSILLMIVLSGRFVKYLAEASAGRLDAETLFAIIGYRIPGFLELILPLAFFIGILLSYGRLYIDNEMTVLSSAGIGPTKLVVYTMAVALLVACLVGWMSLVVSPEGLTKANELLQAQKQRAEIEKMLPRQFLSLDGGAGVSYAENVTEDGKLEGIFLVENRNKRGRSADAELVIIVAEAGVQRKNSENSSGHLVLQQGTRIQGQAGFGDYQVTRFSEYGQRIKVGSQQKRTDVDTLPTKVLKHSNDLDYIAAYQWRLSIPILVLVVALLAVPLSKANPRQGRYVSMLPAILIYIIYLVSLNAARGAVESGSLSPILGLWLVHLGFIFLALMLLAQPFFVRKATHSKYLVNSQSAVRSGR